MPDIKVRVGQTNAVKVVASAFGGSLTAERAVTATNVSGGIASVTSLIVSPGISTFQGSVGLTSDLYVAGISTLAALGGITTTGGDLYVGGDLYINDDITFDEINGRNLNITGISTLGITSATWLESQQLNLSGISTFNEDVKFVGNNTNMRWNHDTSDLTLWNATRLVFGDNEDFQIWHGGTHTFLKNSETGGDLRIRGDKILLKRSDDSGRYLEANKNKDVKLFYNEIEKFATTGVGVTVLGNTETQTLNVTGVSTFAGIVTTSSDLYVGGDLYISDDLVLDNITGNSLKITGLSTFTGNITAVDATFSGNVSVAGTLTHEDVTNIDSVGLITARTGVRITDGGLIVTAGVSTFSSVSNFDADIYVADNIRHKGDGDTYIEFTGDQIRLIAGGKALIHAEEGTIDTVVINDGSNDLDFRVEGQNDNSLIFSDGNTDRVGIGTSAPTAKLDVNGTLNVTGLSTFVGYVGLNTGLTVAGVSTFVGVVTTSSDLYIGGDLYIKDDLTFDEFTAASGNITGILTAATANVTGTLTAGLIDGGSY